MESGELAAFEGAVRAVVPESPPVGLEASLVPRLAREASAASARHAGAPTEQLPVPSRRTARTRRPRLALAAQVAVAITLLPAVMAGLAFAGVALPEPAREAFERVGIELPNQAPADSSESDSDAKSGTNASRGGSQSAAEQSQSRGAGHQGSPDSRGERGADRGQGTSGGSTAAPTGLPDQSQGEGVPQHGEPAPIVPPGQSGTSPGQSGSAPGQSVAPETGPPGGEPPGQAKK
jgi:hypothetical protein